MKITDVRLNMFVTIMSVHRFGASPLWIGKKARVIGLSRTTLECCGIDEGVADTLRSFSCRGTVMLERKGANPERQVLHNTEMEPLDTPQRDYNEDHIRGVR